MALALSFQDRVLYSCSCSQLSTLGELFFCRHCKLPRCQDCVSSTIESFSCPHCFEAAMSDLKTKKGRCSRCFMCPQCFTTLTTRSVIVPSEVLGEQSPQKGEKEKAPPPKTTPPRSATSSLKSPGGTKLYFLSCSHCKWSTRDVDIKDKRSPIDFKDRSSPHQARIDVLIAFYKDYANNDNICRERTKKPISNRRPRLYGSLLDPSKFTSKIPVGSENLSRRSFTWNESEVKKMAAESSDPLPPPDELYTKEINLEEIPMLQQQLKDPIYQPENTKDLWPRQLCLTGKKLHRCKGCDHILMKAEMNLNSIRFKIQQAALHTFPQIRIAECPCLIVGSPNEVLLSVTNPCNYGITVSFSNCSSEYLKRVKEPLSNVSIPDGEFYLTPNDDVMELLDGEADFEIEDDPKFVSKRLPGKLFLKFTVTPEVKVGANFIFSMKFSHKSTIEADKENEMSIVYVPVLVRLNKLICQ